MTGTLENRNKDKLKSDRFFELDLIRSIATVFILLFHFNICAQTNGVAYDHLYIHIGRNLYLGQQGVALFFILSGCTSTLSFQSILQRTDSYKKAVLEYYGKRLLAVLPLYWCAYFIAFLLLRAPGGDVFSLRYLFTLTGLDGFLSVHGIVTPYLVGEWFVGAVLILYLLFPFIFMCIKKSPKCTAFLLAFLYLLLNKYYPFSFDREIDPILRLPEFCIGIYLTGLFHKRKKEWLVAVPSLVIFIICILVPLKIDTMYIILFQGVSLFLILSSFGRMCQKGNNYLVRVLRWVITAFAGISYGVFLVHHFIMEWIIPSYTNMVWTNSVWIRLFIYAFVLSVILAILLRYAANSLIGIIKKFVEEQRYSDR